MNKEILKRIASQSRFVVQCFGGEVWLEGRILSPTEAESAGLLQYLIASQITSQKSMEHLSKLKNQAEKVSEEEDISGLASLIEDARKMGFRPEALGKFHHHQDKIISQCIRRCSTDSGNTWENIQIVVSEDQQNASQNRLWVGLLSNADRDMIINHAMKGHREAEERIAGFFGRK
ncbi:MAG: hypothetical protein CMO80_21955 [Verrucomicrobiales bacterium]|nr:hypothetical protein [Verrucomicrobiales bacterium]|tara:strand:- start:2171 stop:2698 length:528 start_codon:yes stop_codon:yes gene_type:complete